ncbi:MAG TPA: outer membrane protein assembly factor BamD [Vicinamibacterales bacterium]|jgi:outer membrane protein assembly factor BamD
MRAAFFRSGVTLALVLAAIASASCGGGSKRPPTGTPEPDRFLFERGTEALNRKRWLVAREYFRELTDTYPQSRHRADAKLGIGDTYLGEGSAESYVLALNEFREFLAFYPTHQRADYAQYKLGMTHFRQMHSADRDQTETKEAIKEFTTFVQRFPNSELLAEGKQKLREARDRLGQYDYNVGYHYYRSRWLPGAVDRFESLLKRDPEFSRRDSVYFYLGECYLKAGRPAEALPYFDRVIKEFEQSQHLAEAQKRVELIKSEMAKKTQ